MDGASATTCIFSVSQTSLLHADYCNWAKKAITQSTINAYFTICSYSMCEMKFSRKTEKYLSGWTVDLDYTFLMVKKEFYNIYSSHQCILQNIRQKLHYLHIGWFLICLKNTFITISGKRLSFSVQIILNPTTEAQTCGQKYSKMNKKIANFSRYQILWKSANFLENGRALCSHIGPKNAFYNNKTSNYTIIWSYMIWSIRMRRKTVATCYWFHIIFTLQT